VQCDGGAERFAEVEHAGRLDVVAREQRGAGGLGVGVGRVLARAAGAAPVAAVVEQQDIEARGGEQTGVRDAVGDVPGVAVAVQDMADRRDGRRREPAVAAAGDLDLLDPRRRRAEIARGEVEKPAQG
jgi:hypothetical protein